MHKTISCLEMHKTISSLRQSQLSILVLQPFYLNFWYEIVFLIG